MGRPHMTNPKQFTITFHSYFHAAALGDGLENHTKTPLGSAATLAGAYRVAFEAADGLAGRLEIEEEAHRITITQGEQVVSIALVIISKDPEGRRLSTKESLEWALPPGKGDRAYHQTQFDGFEDWLKTQTREGVLEDAKVKIAYHKEQLNYASCPIARTTLQTTLYKVEAELGLKSSVDRHFTDDLGL